MKRAPRPDPISPPAVSPGLRRFLYTTAAVTGAAVMVVEILGARMLSPYIGTSHFVWTAQIAVTLVALAGGYYVGGRLADRSQNLAVLYWSLLGAAGWLVALVRFCEPVSYWCLDFNLVAGSLLASAILFFVPLALLAMTGPFLVRVLTAEVRGVGGQVGRLTAVGTLGSFVGTLLISYVMLPLLPNSRSMQLTALALGLVVAVYFLVFRRHAVAAAAAVLALGTGLGLEAHAPAPVHAHATEVFSGNSPFGEIRVFDYNPSFRLYANDNLTQNVYDPARGQSAYLFTHMLAGLARAYTANVRDVLCIGLGVGLVPMDFVHDGARVDAVEINPAIVPVAEKFFGLEPSRMTIAIDDGRHFLNRCEKQYDVVVLDAFLGDSSPSHLMTREAFQAMRHVLRPGGTLVINVYPARLEPGRDFFPASLVDTLRTVFPGVRVHEAAQQLFIAATDRAQPEFLHAPDFARMHPAIVGEARAAFANRIQLDPGHGQVLTDDFNPVEFYDARNREEARRELLRWARTL